MVGAHLSETNNDPELVQTILTRALGEGAATAVSVAHQDRGFDWVCLD